AACSVIMTSRKERKPAAGATCHGPLLVPIKSARASIKVRYVANVLRLSLHDSVPAVQGDRGAQRLVWLSASSLVAARLGRLPHLTRCSAQSGIGAVHHVALDLALVRPVGHELAHDPVSVERRDALMQTEHGISLTAGGLCTSTRAPGLGVHVEQV